MSQSCRGVGKIGGPYKDLSSWPSRLPRGIIFLTYMHTLSLYTSFHKPLIIQASLIQRFHVLEITTWSLWVQVYPNERSRMGSVARREGNLTNGDVNIQVICKGLPSRLLKKCSNCGRLHFCFIFTSVGKTRDQRSIVVVVVVVIILVLVAFFLIFPLFSFKSFKKIIYSPVFWWRTVKWPIHYR